MDFDDFIRARSAALLRYGYVLSGNPHDAADLTQEALARLGMAWPRVRRRSDPEGYVRKTMARLYISWWRRRRREDLVGVLPERGRTDTAIAALDGDTGRSEEHTSELQSRENLVCRLLLEKKKKKKKQKLIEYKRKKRHRK